MASPTAILRWWMARWVQLPEEKQEQFLDRPETAELEQFSQRVVQEAIGKHQKLVDILGEARVLGHWEPPATTYRSKRDTIHRPGPSEDERGQ